MAPNRKSLVAYEHSLGELENLQGKLIQSNFLPLTHPDERLSSEQVGISSTQQVDSLSYWEWPSVGMKSSSTHVLSSDNIVANLIRASSNNKNDSSLSESTTILLVADHDEYWAEGNESFDFDTL